MNDWERMNELFTFRVGYLKLSPLRTNDQAAFQAPHLLSGLLIFLNYLFNLLDLFLHQFPFIGFGLLEILVMKQQHFLVKNKIFNKNLFHKKLKKCVMIGMMKMELNGSLFYQTKYF